MALPNQAGQEAPESITFGSFDGYKNTVSRERLGPRDLAVAMNIDLDDDGQPHRRRGRTQVASGNFHSLFNADDGTVYGVKNGDLGIIRPDYSFDVLVANATGTFEAGSPQIAWWQIGDAIYFTSPAGAGIISHQTGVVTDWGPAEPFFLSPVVNPSPTLPAIRVKLLGAPPLASDIAYYNGRLYLAAGRFLWATEFQLYDLVDKTRGYIQFENIITMVGVVSDGLYIGTTEGVWFLGGGSFETLKRVRVMDNGVIPGSMTYVPGELANPNIKGTSPPQPMDVSVMFMTTRGYCVGQDSGRCTNMTEATVFFPNAKRAASFYRRQDGMNHYVVALDSQGDPNNAARFGDFVDAEIIRNVGFNPSITGGAPPAVAPIPPVNIDLVNATLAVNLAAPGSPATIAETGTVAHPVITLTIPGATAQTISFTFSSALAVWTVTHNLNRFPSVTVVDSAGDEIYANVDYVDANNLTVTFATPTTGTVYLN